MSSDKPKLAEVSTLYRHNARQIPEMMRKLADELENPPLGSAKVDQCVTIIRDSKTGRFNLYGWGDVTIHDSISILMAGQSLLCRVAHNPDGLWTVPTGGME